MASTSTVPPPPIRFVDRDLRADAERTFYEGLDLLAGVALALDSHCAADTAGKAQILADMLEVGTARLVTARRLLTERAGLR